MPALPPASLALAEYSRAMLMLTYSMFYVPPSSCLQIHSSFDWAADGPLESHSLDPLARSTSLDASHPLMHAFSISGDSQVRA